MPLKMSWTPECRLNIESIDSQHRLLFAIANELLDIHDPVNELPEFKYLINHLRNYVDDHFKHEEDLMKKWSYPGYQEHLEKHEEIIHEINETLLNLHDIRALKERLSRLLYKWIKNHILVEDRKYADWRKAPHPDKF